MTITAPPRLITTELDVQALLDEQTLFKEARRRRRNRRLTTAVLVVFSVGAVALVGSLTVSGSNRPTRITRPTHQVVAGAFTGTWQVKYYVVSIGDSGRGSATWPIKAICGESELLTDQACDTENPTTGVIHDGGHAQIRLVSVTGSKVEGVVSGSTEPSVLPNGKASFSVSGDDVLYIVPTTPTGSSPFGRSSFCGPRAAALSFTQQKAEHIDCGT